MDPYSIPSARKNSRRVNRRKVGTRKQRGGGIFTSRIGGPVKTILDAVNGFVGDELLAIKKAVGSLFDAAAEAVLGASRGSNRVLSGLGSVLTGSTRKNRR